MKKTLILAVIMVMGLVFSLSAYAALELRGTDGLGNRLIYDTDFNITWYDYTKSVDTWQTQMNWASALSVSGGDLVGVYDDWRLPSAGTCASYDCKFSEIGHLWYTELGNVAAYSLSGLIKTGDFQNLQLQTYWSSTEFSITTGFAYGFGFHNGWQYNYNKGWDLSAVAVRTGDVAVVPEPISSILFVTGGTLLAGRRYLRRKK